MAKQIDAEAEQIEAEERRSRLSKGGADRGKAGSKEPYQTEESRSY